MQGCPGTCGTASSPSPRSEGATRRRKRRCCSQRCISGTHAARPQRRHPLHHQCSREGRRVCSSRRHRHRRSSSRQGPQALGSRPHPPCSPAACARPRSPLPPQQPPRRRPPRPRRHPAPARRAGLRASQGRAPRPPAVAHLLLPPQPPVLVLAPARAACCARCAASTPLAGLCWRRASTRGPAVTACLLMRARSCWWRRRGTPRASPAMPGSKRCSGSSCEPARAAVRQLGRLLQCEGGTHPTPTAPAVRT